MRSWLGLGLVVGLCLVTGFVLQQTLPTAHGQGPEKSKVGTRKAIVKKKPIANTDALDTKVSQAEATFVRETETLASEYFEAGHLDKAEALLKKIEAIDPGHPGVKEKLKIISDTQLSANEFTVDVDAGQSWQTAKVMVTKDEPIKIAVEGTYRFIINNAGTPADGFSFDNPDVTMAPGIRCGALMGVIVSEGQGGRKNRVTFPIGTGLESFKPPASGPLFLRINAPPEAKNTGKLKVTLSGTLKAL